MKERNIQRPHFVFILKLLCLDGVDYSNRDVFVQIVDPFTGGVQFVDDFSYAARYIDELDILTADKEYIEHKLPKCKLSAYKVQRR